MSVDAVQLGCLAAWLAGRNLPGSSPPPPPWLACSRAEHLSTAPLAFNGRPLPSITFHLYPPSLPTSYYYLQTSPIVSTTSLTVLSSAIFLFQNTSTRQRHPHTNNCAPVAAAAIDLSPSIPHPSPPIPPHPPSHHPTLSHCLLNPLAPSTDCASCPPRPHDAAGAARPPAPAAFAVKTCGGGDTRGRQRQRRARTRTRGRPCPWASRP